MLCSKVGSRSLLLLSNGTFAESTPQPLTKSGTLTGRKRQPTAMSTISNTHSTPPRVHVSTQIITRNSPRLLIIVMEMLGGLRRIRTMLLQVRIIEKHIIRRENRGRDGNKGTAERAWRLKYERERENRSPKHLARVYRFRIISPTRFAYYPRAE